MSSRLRSALAAVGRIEVEALVFMTAMAMLGVAVALVIIHPANAGTSGLSGAQHRVLVSPYQARPFNRGQAMVSSSRARGRSTPRDVAEAYQRLDYLWLSITDVNTVDPTAGYTTPAIVSLQGKRWCTALATSSFTAPTTTSSHQPPPQSWSGSIARRGLRSCRGRWRARALTPQPSRQCRGWMGSSSTTPAWPATSPPWLTQVRCGTSCSRPVTGLNAVAGDDSLAVVGPESTAGRTSVDVQVAALSPPLIADALKRGAFVDSTGVRILGIDAADGTVTVVTADADAITFIGRDGRVLARTNGPRGQYRVRWDEKYVRAVATCKDGAQAWTMPVWLVP